MKTKRLFFALFPFILLAVVPAARAGLPVVQAVGANTLTARNVTYTVPAGIHIQVDGLASKLSDVHPGMLVDIEQGLDRGTAESIVATTVPPAAPKWKEKNRSLTRGVHGDVLIAITADRITYGSPGTTRAKAALLTPNTRVYVAGKRDEIAALSAGMTVDVSTTDGTHADAIRANDATP